MERVTFCLCVFSSPDKEHNVALCFNYDLRKLHNTKYMTELPSCAEHTTDYDLLYVDLFVLFLWNLQARKEQTKRFENIFKQSRLLPFPCWCGQRVTPHTHSRTKRCNYRGILNTGAGSADRAHQTRGQSASDRRYPLHTHSEMTTKLHPPLRRQDTGQHGGGGVWTGGWE